MKLPPLRVAFFTDSFYEVNGVALTSRQLEAFAERRQFPFLSVHAGPETTFRHEGSIRRLELQRSPASFAVDSDLYFDPLFQRHKKRVKEALEEFHADVVHITALGDCGILGAVLGHEMSIPIVGSWHTNLHEFGAWRLEKTLWFMPEKIRKTLSGILHDGSLKGFLKFYQVARVVFAPNEELRQMLTDGTGKPAFLMERGVDTDAFSPAHRDREDDIFTIGFVGRLKAEKNLRFLQRVGQTLIDAGETDFRFSIVGQGSELDWLKENVPNAEFPGVLKGQDLARAYANFDLFAFPSHTDTFGNVILEALASGVPPVVTTGGGPKYLVDAGNTGFVAETDEAFIEAVLTAKRDKEGHAAMCRAAREDALQRTWDSVFERLYDNYHEAPRQAMLSRSQSAA